jgi:hypothetical protein
MARENCLTQLKEMTTKLTEDGKNTENQIQHEKIIEKSSELLTHLRILSLNVVECILRWREYIQQIYYLTRSIVKTNQTIMIPFMFNDANYLIKVYRPNKILTYR